MFGDQPATVAAAIEAATKAGQSERPQQLDALLGVAGERNGDINTRKLGRYLKQQVRRIENSLRFEYMGIETRSCRPLYRVIRVSSVSPSHSREICK
jgi:hypothetical protein